MDRSRQKSYALEKLDARFVFIGVIALIVVIILLSMGYRTESGIFHEESDQIHVNARSLPSEGTYPGGSAAVRVSVSNVGSTTLNDVIVEITLPKRSGLTIDANEFTYQTIPVINPDGNRELFFPLDVNRETLEGTYSIMVEVRTADGNVVETTETRLEIIIGSQDRCYGQQCEGPSEWL